MNPGSQFPSISYSGRCLNLKLARWLACCLIACVSTNRQPVPARRADAPFHAKRDSQFSFAGPMQEAFTLFRSGRYQDALAKFQSIREIAQRRGDLDYVARATADMGACQFALHQYPLALRSFQTARALALVAGDKSGAAVFEGNIASLYMELGNLDAAAEWMKDSLREVSGRDRVDQLAKLQIQMATLLARQRKTEAWDYFRQGMERADRAGDMELYANAWNRIGEEYLKQADPDEGIANANQGDRKQLLDCAEAALLEAYRVRKLNRLPLDTSYRNLGRLRLAQGDLASANALLDRAVELAERPQGVLPSWDLYYQRGLARLRQNHPAAALHDLRVAVKLGRTWRWSAPADQAASIGTEGWLDKVYSALIEAGNRLYQQTGNAALARETFEAAEENRAGSLRTLASRTNPATMPAGFWEALVDLQRAEVQALRSGGGETQQALASAHARLVSLEASLGPEWHPLQGGLLERTRRALRPDTAWFSFHLGEPDSWLWALDSDGLTLYRLPARSRIQIQIQAVGDAIRENRASADPVSETLYRTLFGQVAPRFRRKPRWLLALDRELFEVPIAALRDGGRYLVETHTTAVIPGAGYWLDAAERRRAPASPSLFVGIGDPIYNTADERLPVPPVVRHASMLPFEVAKRSSNTGGSLMLPRLVASAAELDACARAWKGDHILLEGEHASRRELVAEIAQEPAVLHFATHFLEFPGKQADSGIALGLTSGKEIDLLTPEEIVHWPVRAGLVVLSGCHSAAGAVLPGTGLLGLTRAFLAAGAGAVVSSRWATPDDDGALFAVFYGSLRSQWRTRNSTDAAGALREAQLATIRSGGERARPRYWSAFFLVGDL